MANSVVTSLGLLIAVASVGCSATALRRTSADDLRDRIRDLEEEVATLTAANAELRASLAAAHADSGPAEPPPQLGARWNAADVAAETPRAVQVALGWGSAIETTADAGRANLTLYLEPQDALGRVVQVAGYVDVRVVAVGEPGAAAAETLADVRIEPRTLRESWRSGMFGSHYTLAIPIDRSRSPDATAFAVAVVLYEGLDARPLTARTTLDLSAGG